MLKITPEQLVALESSMAEDFERQLTSVIIATYPEHAQDADGVAAVVAVAGADARSMGLTGAAGIGLYVLAAFLLGMAIRDDPRVHSAIRDSNASEATKALWLERWLVAIGSALD